MFDGVGNGQHRVALAVAVSRGRVAVARDFFVGVEDARIDRFAASAWVVVVGMVVVDVDAFRIFEVGMVVVADVKMQVEKPGAHLAVVVPVVGGVQPETNGAHSSDEQQAEVGPGQNITHGSASSSHLMTPS